MVDQLLLLEDDYRVSLNCVKIEWSPSHLRSSRKRVCIFLAISQMNEVKTEGFVDGQEEVSENLVWMTGFKNSAWNEKISTKAFVYDGNVIATVGFSLLIFNEECAHLLKTIWMHVFASILLLQYNLQTSEAFQIVRVKSSGRSLKNSNNCRGPLFKT